METILDKMPKNEAAASDILEGLYQEGLSDIRNHELVSAVKNLQQAAHFGHPGACSQLSRFFIDGIVVTKNEEYALKLLSHAAECGDPSAQAKLGKCYQTGRGTAINHEQAFKWFSRAYAGGQYQPNVPTCLGVCYFNGEGAERNLAKALHLFSEGAEGKDPYAEWNLFLMFCGGIGVSVDNRCAYEYCERAANGGHMGARRVVERVRSGSVKLDQLQSELAFER